MCEQCTKVNKQIEHYRSLSNRVTDRRTLEGIDLLIARLEAEKRAFHPEHATTLAPGELTDRSMKDDSEIDWHREQIAKNRELLAELEKGNTDGGDVFPETQNEIDRLTAQIEQSELIVAAYEKEHPQA